MKHLKNPYIVGSPVQNSEMFFGREDVFHFIQNALIGEYQDNVIILYGQRRTGKTSILYQLLNHKKLGDNYIPVLISLEGLQELKSNAHLFGEIAQKIFSVLENDLQTGKPKIDDFDPTNTYFRYEFLEQKIRPVLKDRKLLLMIDEYEVLEQCIDNPRTDVNVTLFYQLRHLMQHYDWISFLLNGSHKMEELNSNYWKEFTGAIYHKISFLDPKSAKSLIEEPVKRDSVKDEPANKYKKDESANKYKSEAINLAIKYV